MALGDVALSEDLSVFGFSGEDCVSLISTFGYLCYQEPDSPVIDDHCQAALNRLAEQYKNRPNLANLICTFIDQIQDAEYTFQDLKIGFVLATASGVQLDAIGEIVGIGRTSPDDAVYRNDIRDQIGINNSNGTGDDVLNFVQLKTSAVLIDYSEIHPAKIRLDIVADYGNIPSNLIETTERVALAGVGVEMTHTDPGNPAFAFSEPSLPDDPDTLGFAEPSLAGTGGSLVEPIL